ncbi:hypothetical protein D3C80_998270 [compost metagenome]
MQTLVAHLVPIERLELVGIVNSAFQHFRLARLAKGGVREARGAFLQATMLQWLCLLHFFIFLLVIVIGRDFQCAIVVAQCFAMKGTPAFLPGRFAAAGQYFDLIVRMRRDQCWGVSTVPSRRCHGFRV